MCVEGDGIVEGKMGLCIEMRLYLCLCKCERRNGSVYVERLGYVCR